MSIAAVDRNSRLVDLRDGSAHGADISCADASHADPPGGAVSFVSPLGFSSTVRYRRRRAAPALYAALDLGTNNCRLLIARPTRESFRVVDAFSRIVRLGEGLSTSGRLSKAAMDRAVDALRVCRQKLENRGVRRARLIATEACRAADNAEEFCDSVQRETGLKLEIIDRATEARLAAIGCAPLFDPASEGVLLFDIGGGSSELVWLSPEGSKQALQPAIKAWASLPVGVVTLAESFGGVTVTPEVFGSMVRHVQGLLENFAEREVLAAMASRLHMLGTSGTVTTLAGIHMGLLRYERHRVDGTWLTDVELSAVMDRLRGMSYDERVANPCIGRERADLVLAGCAILEAIRLTIPCTRLRVADRGLREGILLELIRADQAHPRRRAGDRK